MPGDPRGSLAYVWYFCGESQSILISLRRIVNALVYCSYRLQCAGEDVEGLAALWSAISNFGHAVVYYQGAPLTPLSRLKLEIGVQPLLTVFFRSIGYPVMSPL